MINPTSTSSRMGDCVPRASIAPGSRECYTAHSFILAMIGMLWSTIADCTGSMASIGATLA
jgi:hypothetical protein